MQPTFRLDDLTGEATRRLIAAHLDEMRLLSPPTAVFALDVVALRAPDVTFWSAWSGDAIAGCGALRRIDADRGEIKSMHVPAAFRGRGVGRAILGHLIAEARARGMRSLWLETGSAAGFAPAQRLYESAGFTRCGPFDPYIDNGFSVFMTLVL